MPPPTNPCHACSARPAEVATTRKVQHQHYRSIEKKKKATASDEGACRGSRPLWLRLTGCQKESEGARRGC